MAKDLLERIAHHLIVADGAMGTMIYSKGVPIAQSYDELNRSHPEIILDIHRAYVAAGAQAIETNTFTANRIKLSRYGLEQDTTELNERGARLAREAAGTDVFVLGSVGPLRGRETEEITPDDMRQAFTEQISALASGGVDVILFETFGYLEDLLAALKCKQAVTDLPAICQLNLDDEGFSRDGVHVVQAFERLRQAGADVVGVNCMKGPAGMLRVLEQVALQEGLYLSAMPNAGLPAYVDGRYMYLSSPDYFAESALKLRQQGVRLFGGCCGTTPEHVRAIAEALEGLDPIIEKKVVVRFKAVPTPRPHAPVESPLLQQVKSEKTVIVELDPPRTLKYEVIIQGARALQKAGADAITMADNSLGVTRMNNVALGYLVKEKVGLRPIIHISCRDKNLIGLQSELMGLYALGIDHVLALTGDPAKWGDQPGATSVYDLNSIKLVELIKQLNNGISFSGRNLDERTHFTVGVAFNPHVPRLEPQISRLRKKIAAGADFIMTQPIYDPELAETIHDALQEFDIPVFVGVMPLVSARNAEFLHNEVPGIEIPEAIRQRMAAHDRGEKARQEGIAISRDVLDAILDLFNGIYLITPFARYEMTAALSSYVCERSRK
jgi:homocysteine S-methyltransferase